MAVRFADAQVYTDGKIVRKDVLFPDAAPTKSVVFHNCLFLPGHVDVHVHLREPGFSYKETIASGTAAAAHGGYTTVCAMPNLNPVPDSLETLQQELRAINHAARIPVWPYGAITRGERGGELADLAAMAPFVCGFSDDGRGVQDAGMMEAAMRECRRLGKLLAAHCEDNSLLSGGCIHDGAYARAHGHPGISSESEWRQVERDLALAEKTGCRYHVCHISTKESVALVRAAKKRGADVSCETAPHYLVLTDEDLQEDGRFKMNPPVRSREDREALLEGILDGTIDCIATDHAPHSLEEKSRGLEKSLMGVVGLETAFPVLYTKLVLPGLVPLERLVRLMSDRPRERFGFPDRRDYAVFDVGEPYTINPETFLSQGRATPFAGERVFGRCLLTVCSGEAVWQDERLENCFEVNT